MASIRPLLAAMDTDSRTCLIFRSATSRKKRAKRQRAALGTFMSCVKSSILLCCLLPHHVNFVGIARKFIRCFKDKGQAR